MKKFQFNDTHKFPPGGYVTSAATDIRKTFDRERKRLAELAVTKAQTVTLLTTMPRPRAVELTPAKPARRQGSTA